MVPARKVNATFAHWVAIPGRVAFVGQSGTIAVRWLDLGFAAVSFSHIF